MSVKLAITRTAIDFFVVIEDLHEKCSAAKYPMRLHEIQPAKPIKPKTPDQQRVASLQRQSKIAAQAVKAERARQQQRTAQQMLATVQKAIATV